MKIKIALFQIAFNSGCLVWMVDSAFAARINAGANVAGALDTQESSTPGATVVAFVTTFPLAEAESRVGSDFNLCARSFSNAAGEFAGIATTGLTISPFVINGNSNNVELPLSFNFSLSGNIPLTPTDRIFSGAGSVGTSVSLVGADSRLASWNGSTSFGITFTQGRSLITAGGIVDEDVDIGAGNLNLLVDASDSFVTSSTVSTTLDTGAAGGNVIVGADFLKSFELLSVSTRGRTIQWPPL